MRLFDFKCLLVISLTEHIVAFRDVGTKTLNRYTPFDKNLKSHYLRNSKKRRLLDYNYENWFNNNFNNNIFNTDIYGILRENNNIVTAINTETNKEPNINLTSKVTPSADPTSELKLTTLSRNISNDAQDTTVSNTLIKPDFRTNTSTTIATTSKATDYSNTASNLSDSVTTTSSTITTEKDLSRISNIETEFTTLTSVLNETTKRVEVTPTSEQKLTSVSNLTDLTNFDETTRDWRDIISFSVLPEDTIADLLLLYANTTPYITTSTLKPPPLLNPTAFMGTTKNILDFTHTTITTRNPFLVQIEEKIHTIKDGYFTCILIVLLRHLLEKNASETRSLLNGVNVAIVSMGRDEELSMFSPDAVELLQSVVQMLILEPSDMMREHLKYAIYALENRRGFLGHDVNSIFTVVDTVYTPDDVYTIADFLRDEIAGFPNKTKTPSAIARKAINLFIIYPHARIRGTAKSGLLMRQLSLAIQSRMLVPSRLDQPRLGEIQEKLRRLNKEDSKSLQHEKYYPRRTNKIAKTFLGSLPTRTRWKHTRTIHESMRKMKTLLVKEKLYTVTRSTKLMYKFRKKHPLQVINKTKEYHIPTNATEIYKLRKKNTHAISDGSFTASKDSETVSTENKFNTNLKRDQTRNVNQYKKSRRSSLNINEENINIKSKQTAIFQQRRNNFYRKSNEYGKTKADHSKKDLNDGYNYSNESFENKNIRAKLVDWVNKYTNVIYQKLNNEKDKRYLRTNTLLVNSKANNHRHPDG